MLHTQSYLDTYITGIAAGGIGAGEPAASLKGGVSDAQSRSGKDSGDRLSARSGCAHGFEYWDRPLRVMIR